MPNLKPPIRTLAEAQIYKNRILSSIPVNLKRDFCDILMSLYITDHTSVEDIVEAKNSGVVYGAKLYPAGATTNSDLGVTSIEKIKHVLQAMSDVGLPMLVHGEVVDKNVDIFDRERVFIDTVLRPIVLAFPRLKIVMEHITTAEAVNFIYECNERLLTAIPTAAASPESPTVVATITAHHLLYNRSDIFTGGICPHMYCLPVLKRESHRQALLKAATRIFSGPAAVELYAEAFDSVGALDNLEGFTSVFGQRYYGLAPHQHRITLRREDWTAPNTYEFGDAQVRPLRAGEIVRWKIV
eukprot:gene28062-36949_t